MTENAAGVGGTGRAKRTTSADTATAKRTVKRTAKKQTAAKSGSNATSRSNVPPAFDAEAMSRVVPRVEIRSLDLIGAHFFRADDGPIPTAAEEGLPDSIGIGVEWSLIEDGSQLGCALTFATDFEGSAPYELLARFRVVYNLSPGERPHPDDLEQFVYWNAVFNAYPYWREFVSSTLSRAGLPQFAVPVLRMPRHQ